MAKQIGVHFLLSTGARTLSVEQVCAMKNEEIDALFHKFRWPDTGGEPCCPECGSMAAVTVPKRPCYRCKSCGIMFSVTSGTFLHGHKLTLRRMLIAIVLLADAVKGMSASQLSRHIGIQYKTAYVLCHKIRASMLNENDTTVLSGDVEVDGAYFDTKKRKPNVKPDAKKKAAEAEVQSDAEKKAADEAEAQDDAEKKPVDEAEKKDDGKKKKNKWEPTPRCILVARQISKEPGVAATKSVIGFVSSENGADVDEFMARHVEEGSNVTTDEHRSYAMLVGHYNLKQVNHSERYSGPDGQNINRAESFFSRFRRMEIGQMHKFGRYLVSYAAEVAWRENNRRQSNGNNARTLLGLLLKTNPNHQWQGYWKVYTKRKPATPLPVPEPLPLGLAM